MSRTLIFSLMTEAVTLTIYNHTFVFLIFLSCNSRPDVTCFCFSLLFSCFIFLFFNVQY